MEFIRADDNTQDLMLAIVAMVFYVLGGCLLLISIAEKGFLVGAGFALLFAIVFHIVKVSSDGRVRTKRAQYVQRAERERIDFNGGAC